MQAVLFGKRYNIKKEWKTAVTATWIIGLLAHAYRFFNFLPIWDSMYNFQGVGDTFYLGRWALGYAGYISSIYDLPWLNGALSLCYISAAMILVIELYQISDTLLIVLTAGIFVSFPTVVASFAYMYTADAYFLSFLLATAAVYLTWRFQRWGIFPGMVCLCLSMGIYQAYAGTAIVLILILILRQFIFERMDFWKAVRQDFKYPVMLLGGAVFYFLVQKAFMAVLHYTLSGYQGVNAMGIMSPGEYKAAFIRCFREFLTLLGLGDGVQNQIYTEMNLLILLLLFLFLLYCIIKQNVYKRPLSFASVIAAVFLLPVGAYIINFTTPEVAYHTLMEMGVCFVYLLFLLLINHLDVTNRLQKVMRVAGTAAVCLLLYVNVVNSNIAYYHMNLSYHKSYAIAENILDRMEEIEEFQTVTNKVAIFGDYDAETTGLEEMTPSIVGISSQSFLNSSYHYVSFWNYCFGVQVWRATDEEELTRVRATEEFQDMPVYPAAGSVRYLEGRMMDGVWVDSMIVIKLSDT